VGWTCGQDETNLPPLSKDRPGVGLLLFPFPSQTRSWRAGSTDLTLCSRFLSLASPFSDTAIINILDLLRMPMRFALITQLTVLQEFSRMGRRGLFYLAWCGRGISYLLLYDLSTQIVVHY